MSAKRSLVSGMFVYHNYWEMTSSIVSTKAHSTARSWQMIYNMFSYWVSEVWKLWIDVL